MQLLSSPTHPDIHFISYDICRVKVLIEIQAWSRGVVWGVHGCEGGYSSETDIGQNASLAPFVNMFLFPFSTPFPPCPSIWIPLGWRRKEGRGFLVSFPRPVPQGGFGLLCELVSHMIEIHLILLGINLLQWNRGDRRGRIEVKMKGRMIEGRGE